MTTTKPRTTPTIDDVDEALRSVQDFMGRPARVSELVDWLTARGFDVSYTTITNRLAESANAVRSGKSWRHRADVKKTHK